MKYEYKVIEVGKTKGWLFKQRTLSESEFNELGKVGWELVSAFSVGSSAPGYGSKKHPDQIFLIFKRPIGESQTGDDRQESEDEPPATDQKEEKTCRKCGTANPCHARFRFCTSCGAELK